MQHEIIYPKHLHSLSSLAEKKHPVMTLLFWPVWEDLAICFFLTTQMIIFGKTKPKICHLGHYDPSVGHFLPKLPRHTGHFQILDHDNK